MLRKLLLLAGMLVAAMAFMTSSANAQETGVTVTKEDTGTCNPCVIEVEGESRLDHPLIGQLSSCRDRFEANIFTNGTGSVPAGSATLSHHPGLTDCASVPCANEAWPFVAGETGGSTEHIVIDFCLFDGTTNRHCEVEVNVEDGGDHHYLLSVSNHMCPTGLLLTGNWEVHNSSTIQNPDRHDAVEITHDS